MVWGAVAMALAVLWVWFRWSHRQLLSMAAKLPDLEICRSWPILGHPPAITYSVNELGTFALSLSMEAARRQLKTVALWCGPMPLVILHDMEDIQNVLNSSNSSEKANEYESFKFGFEDENGGSLTYGLLTAPGHVWKITRRHMNPLFHQRNVRQLMPVFNKNSHEMVARLGAFVDKGPVDFWGYTMDASLKTVCNLMYGPEIEVDVHSQSFKDLMHVVEMVPESFIKRLVRPWLRIDALYKFLYRKQIKWLNTTWANFTFDMIKKTKQNNNVRKVKSSMLSDKDWEDNTNNEDKETVNLVDVYAALHQTYPQFNDTDMLAEVLTLYCTGTDTVGSSTASCLLAMAQYQDIQERVFREIKEKVGMEEDITLEDLNSLTYLDQVVKETFRRFNIVPYVLRKTAKDMPLSTCTVPAQSTMVLCLAAIHMDPRNYPDPYKFDPERFAPENAAGKERFAYVPFSGGPRNCIGKFYAMQLMKVMIIQTLRKYKVTTTMDIHSLKTKLMVTLVSVDGYFMSLEKRSTSC